MYTIKTKKEVFKNLSRIDADRIINRLLNEGTTFEVVCDG